VGLAERFLYKQQFQRRVLAAALARTISISCDAPRWTNGGAKLDARL
jgi:hypothetical protein